MPVEVVQSAWATLVLYQLYVEFDGVNHDALFDCRFILARFMFVCVERADSADTSKVQTEEIKGQLIQLCWSGATVD